MRHLDRPDGIRTSNHRTTAGGRQRRRWLTASLATTLAFTGALAGAARADAVPAGHGVRSSTGPWSAVIEVRTDPTTVPDVLGQQAVDAVDTVRAAGLTVLQRSVVDPTCEVVGLVVAQSPAGGTVVIRGSAVSLTIGRRPMKLCG